jgi:hypothetical protein
MDLFQVDLVSLLQVVAEVVKEIIVLHTQVVLEVQAVDQVEDHHQMVEVQEQVIHLLQLLLKVIMADLELVLVLHQEVVAEVQALQEQLEHLQVLLELAVLEWLLQ